MTTKEYERPKQVPETREEILDIVEAYFSQDPPPRLAIARRDGVDIMLGETLTCVYRADPGDPSSAACAVGCLIPDDVFVDEVRPGKNTGGSSLNFSVIGTVLSRLGVGGRSRMGRLAPHRKLLAEMQDRHDECIFRWKRSHGEASLWDDSSSLPLRRELAQGMLAFVARVRKEVPQ